MDEAKLAVLLRAIDRGVRRLTPADLIDAQRWLNAEPELGASQLRAGLASLLARDPEEWRRIARLVEQFCDRRLDATGVTAVAEAPRSADASAPVRRVHRPDTPMPPVVGALVAAGRTGRVVVLGGAITLAVALLIVSPWLTQEVVETVELGVPEPSGVQTTEPPAAVVSEQAWKFVERASAQIITARLPLSLGWTWSFVLCLASAALVALGLRWRRLATEAQSISEQQDAEAEAERKALEDTWVKQGAPPLHLFSVDPPPPLAEKTLVDSAALLTRIRASEPSAELDVEGTARRTADQAGRVVEVYHTRTLPLPLVLCLDLGAGDHPWRQRMERVALSWRQQGVALDLFVFRGHDPGTVYRWEDREPMGLAELGRRTEGRPLVLMSHGLSARALRGTKAWARALDAWPRRVWIDPDPRPPDKHKRAEIADLGSRGLTRFPFNDDGLLAALRALAGGAPVEVPAAVPAPAVGEAAFAAWALAAALVPDPTWDQLESFRARIPMLAAAFPDASHVVWLEDWVARQPESEGEARRSAGDGLAVSTGLQDRLLRQWRAAAATAPELRELAAQVDRLLLEQLSRSEPAHGSWEHAVWSLKIAWIRARLHPEQAFLQLAPALEGPLRRAAALMLRGELERQSARPLAGADWVLSTREVLADAVDTEPRLGLTRLVALPSWKSVALSWMAAGIWAAWVFGLDIEVASPASAELPAVTAVEAWQRSIVQAHGMTLVEIPEGSFWMGSPEDEAGRDVDETRHRVTLTRPFMLATTEVTQGLYREVMGTLPECTLGERQAGDNLPMHCVSWDDAVAFAAKLSKMDGLPAGQGYRLPTEAEWEYAARAGASHVYAGISETAEVCGFANVADATAKAANPEWTTFDCTDGRSGLAPVGSYRANAWGLFDMTGNVWEWTADWYGDYAGPATDPSGPPSGSNRVYRGGSWWSVPAHARVAYRFSSDSSYLLDLQGFRLARSLPSALSPSDPPPQPAAP
jgi:formylglycine-generating enzyme required for sulfatase activity